MYSSTYICCSSTPPGINATGATVMRSPVTRTPKEGSRTIDPAIVFQPLSAVRPRAKVATELSATTHITFRRPSPIRFGNQHWNWWDTVMSTRLNDQKTAAKIVIMQRCHQRDLSGHVLEQGGWEHLCLPAEYETPRVATSFRKLYRFLSNPWRRHRRAGQDMPTHCSVWL